MRDPAPRLLADSDLTALVLELEREEHAASERRSQLHERIDALRGGASDEDGDLAVLEEEERALSRARHVLHWRLDEARAEQARRSTEAP